ncbi:MAG: molybdopterin-dependent oxidoreductase, partial [Pseudomonadota bacterium]
PGSDTAIMMGMAHTLIKEGLHDAEFLTKYTVGFDRVEAYLMGTEDGVPKDAKWASAQSGINAETIEKLAREAASRRTMLTLAAGLQRADFGEQPVWMVVTLAAILGQIGLPGGGCMVGSAVNGNVGNIERSFRAGTIPQGTNPVNDFIPVAMISEMLLKPGESYEYDGQQRTFPNIKFVWWAGGNPFHHHQDLNRLRKAFQTPETVIVNEINWTATARHADIVLPVSSTLERNDFGAGRSDNGLVPMPAAIDPLYQSRTEFDIYASISERLDKFDEFTDGKDENAWLEELWEQTRKKGKDVGMELPQWSEFIAGDVVETPDPSPDQVFLADFRLDPDKNALPTQSGRIELFCEKIAGFGLDDCHGHASYFEPRDLAAGLKDKYPLFLISGQPATRLHSQFDNGERSIQHKIKEREPVFLNTDDAKERRIQNGDVVELFNERGACLAGAVVFDDIAKGCVFLWTGAWYDPDFGAELDRDNHGNPNVLTHDLRTSTLTQSPAAHSALIEIRKFEGELRKITCHDQPEFVLGQDDLEQS